MSNLIKVFAQGFIFIGEPSANNNSLIKAMQVQPVNAMGPQGPVQFSMNTLIGDLKLPLSDFPCVPIDEKNPSYADYVELTTGIKLERGKIFH